MNIHVAIAGAWLVFATASAQAQNTDDPKAWSEQFLQAVSENIDKAYDRFREETVLGRSNRLVAEQLRELSRTSANGLGHAQSVEIVAAQRLGQHWMRVIGFIHRRLNSEVYLLHFRQIRTDGGWDLLAVQIDNRIFKFPWDYADAR